MINVRLMLTSLLALWQKYACLALSSEANCWGVSLRSMVISDGSSDLLKISNKSLETVENMNLKISLYMKYTF